MSGGGHSCHISTFDLNISLGSKLAQIIARENHPVRVIGRRNPNNVNRCQCFRIPSTKRATLSSRQKFVQ